MRWFLLTLASFVAGFAFASWAAEAPPTDGCCNTVCPVDGKAVDPKVPAVEMRMDDAADAPLVQVGTCSAQCAAEVKAHPEKYRVPIWATMKDQELQKRIKAVPKQEVIDECANTACPVCGKPIDASVPPMRWRSEHGPKNPDGQPKSLLIGFCSMECCEKFRKEPEKFATPEWLQQKTKTVK